MEKDTINMLTETSFEAIGKMMKNYMDIINFMKDVSSREDLKEMRSTLESWDMNAAKATKDSSKMDFEREKGFIEIARDSFCLKGDGTTMNTWIQFD